MIHFLKNSDDGGGGLLQIVAFGAGALGINNLQRPGRCTDVKTYSIIGSGNIGSAVARQFARKSIDVAIANNRGPDSLAALRKELGHHIDPQTLEAALKADTVILAVPFSAVSAIARAGSGWTGKIVIDATNAIDFPAFTPTESVAITLERSGLLQKLRRCAAGESIQHSPRRHPRCRSDRGRRTPRTLHFRK